MGRTRGRDGEEDMRMGWGGGHEDGMGRRT